MPKLAEICRNLPETLDKVSWEQAGTEGNLNRFCTFCRRHVDLTVARNVTARGPKQGLTAEPHETGHSLLLLL